MTVLQMAGPLALMGLMVLLPSPLGWARQTDGPLARNWGDGDFRTNGPPVCDCAP